MANSVLLRCHIPIWSYTDCADQPFCSITQVKYDQANCIVILNTGIRRLLVPPLSGQHREHSFLEIDHKILSTTIISLLLIQEGQLSFSGERMCTILVNGLSLLSKCVVRYTNCAQHDFIGLTGP